MVFAFPYDPWGSGDVAEVGGAVQCSTFGVWEPVVVQVADDQRFERCAFRTLLTHDLTLSVRVLDLLPQEEHCDVSNRNDELEVRSVSYELPAVQHTGRNPIQHGSSPHLLRYQQQPDTCQENQSRQPHHIASGSGNSRSQQSLWIPVFNCSR